MLYQNEKKKNWLINKIRGVARSGHHDFSGTSDCLTKNVLNKNESG